MLISVCLLVLIVLRIVVGLSETSEVIALRRISGNHVYYVGHRDGEPFPGYRKLIVGLKGRSNADVEGLSLILVGDADLKRVATHFPNLKFLWLHHSSVTLNGLRHLQTCGKLEDLDLTDSDLGDDTVKLILDSLRLESLTLNGMYVTDASGPVIAKAIESGKLRTIHVSQTELSMEAIEELRTKFAATGLYIGTEKDLFPDGILGGIRWSDGCLAMSRSSSFAKTGNFDIGR